MEALAETKTARQEDDAPASVSAKDYAATMDGFFMQKGVAFFNRSRAESEDTRRLMDKLVTQNGRMAANRLHSNPAVAVMQRDGFSKSILASISTLKAAIDAMDSEVNELESRLEIERVNVKNEKERFLKEPTAVNKNRIATAIKSYKSAEKKLSERQKNLDALRQKLDYQDMLHSSAKTTALLRYAWDAHPDADSIKKMADEYNKLNTSFANIGTEVYRINQDMTMNSEANQDAQAAILNDPLYASTPDEDVLLEELERILGTEEGEDVSGYEEEAEDAPDEREVIDRRQSVAASESQANGGERSSTAPVMPDVPRHIFPRAPQTELNGEPAAVFDDKRPVALAE